MKKAASFLVEKTKSLRKDSYLLKSETAIRKNIASWDNSLTDTTGFYLDAYRFFRKLVPEEVRSHKRYFQQEKRGFGEEAFHSMWFLLYEKFHFENFLEIGVYRGQVMSLIAYMARLAGRDIAIYGISPFDKSGDRASHYIDIDYMQDVYKNFSHFSLPKPNLINAYSTEPEALTVIESKKWDCIYIDGSHDYEIVKQDWGNCSANVKEGGLIIFDDASLYIENYTAPFFAFKGHTGPSAVSDEVDSEQFKEILRIGHNRVFQKISS